MFTEGLIAQCPNTRPTSRCCQPNSLPPCQGLWCLELSLPGALSLSPYLLPVSAHRAHPTHCVLSSALKTPPGSRTLPRGISVLASQVRKTLKRGGSFLLANEWVKELDPLPQRPTDLSVECPRSLLLLPKPDSYIAIPPQPQQETESTGPGKHLSFQVAPALMCFLKSCLCQCRGCDVQL